MAARLDVAARLAEGRPAVENTQRYVLACQQIGYQHPDLTGDSAQIRDWYLSEDGLDLHALDADCEQLRSTAAVAAEALRVQRAQAGVLAAAWEGPGSQSAVEFVARHCAAANTLVAEVRAAAQRLESLRDNLWYLVDAKVTTVIAIDDRTLPQRPVWLAAAAGVAAADRAAQELVHQQVKPYVDNDIRNDWLNAMNSARSAIAASYDMVSQALAAAPRTYFEIPGDLGPPGMSPGPLPETVPSVLARQVGAAASPASWASHVPATSVTPAAPSPQGAPGSSLTPNSALTQPDWGSGLGSAAGTSGGSGGLGGGDLGGLGGLASRFVQAMGGLLGSTGDPPGDDNLLDESAEDDPEDPDEAVGRSKRVAKIDDVAAATTPPGDQAATGTQPLSAAGSPAGTPVVAGSPPSAPPVAPPVIGPPAKSPVGGSTPCEIAANALPQAGQ